MNKHLNGPYAGNILINGLPPIPNENTILRHLTVTSEMPGGILVLPTETRLHHLQDILHRLHIPSLEGCRLAETIDLMIRRGYSIRNPAEACTWQQVMGSISNSNCISKPFNISACADGFPGVGKTIAVRQTLRYYPQVIAHQSFPNILGSHYQVVWLSIEVPASGKLEDFCAQLMREWDRVLPENQSRFTDTLNAKTRNGGRMFEEWNQVAKSHFLGFLHLDEVQNFFKIPTLKQRLSKRAGNRLDLSLVEDKLLKIMLILINSGLPILFSGTPDGISAMSNRFSTGQRMSSFGCHEFLRFDDPNDAEYREFLGELVKYQYVRSPLIFSEEMACLIIELTGGIRRLIINLWLFAHRVAYRRGGDDLLLEDFKVAERLNFKKIRPAVRALISGDPYQIAQYADLLGGFQ